MTIEGLISPEKNVTLTAQLICTQGQSHQDFMRPPAVVVSAVTSQEWPGYSLDTDQMQPCFAY